MSYKDGLTDMQPNLTNSCPLQFEYGEPKIVSDYGYNNNANIEYCHANLKHGYS